MVNVFCKCMQTSGLPNRKSNKCYSNNSKKERGNFSLLALRINNCRRNLENDNHFEVHNHK